MGFYDCVSTRRLVVQRTVATIASSIVFLVGFPDIDSELPILSQLRSRRFVSLYVYSGCCTRVRRSMTYVGCRYLGLLMNILLFIMFALSTLLIYSLLLINVNSRTFELAIRRMLGSTRPALILLLVAQVQVLLPAVWPARRVFICIPSLLTFRTAVGGGCSLSVLSRRSPTPCLLG